MSKERSWAKVHEELKNMPTVEDFKTEMKKPVSWKSFWVWEIVGFVVSIVLVFFGAVLAPVIFLVTFPFFLMHQVRSHQRAREAQQALQQQAPVTYNGPWNH